MATESCCKTFEADAYYSESTKPVGAIEQLKTKSGSVEAYTTGTGNKYLVILTDVRGHTCVNTQRYADQIAKLVGIRVVVMKTLKTSPIWPNFQFSEFPAWLEQNPVSWATEQLFEYLDTLHADDKTQSIALLGICYGAKPEMAALAKAEYKLLKGGVFNHPSFLTPDDVSAAQADKAYLIHAPKGDVQGFPDTLHDAFKSNFAERKVKHTIRIIDGVKHGFTTRPEGEKEEEEATKAKDVTVTFLKEIL